MLETGQVLDRYRVDSELGAGGVATVYKVIHTRLGSEHALKVVMVPTEAQKKRLLQEGRTQANIRHPNLVTVTDVLEIGDSPALVMEYVNGPSLDEWLEDSQPDLNERMQMFAGIVKGVGAAHAAGLVHRDLKPSNVLIAQTADGLLPKVTDFGLVKPSEKADGSPITQPGLIGTPQYMAPEQINEEVVDQRADMFALGCILYEMVCGQRAFDTDDHIEAYNRILAGDFTSPEIVNHNLPPLVSSAIRRLLRTDPTTRPANCDVLLNMLFGTASSSQTFDSGDSFHSSEVVDNSSIMATPIYATRRGSEASLTPPPPLVSFPQATTASPERRQIPWTLGVAVAVALLVAMGLFGFVLGGMGQAEVPVHEEILLPATPPRAPEPVVEAAPAPAPEPEVVEEIPEAPPPAAPKSSFSVSGDATDVQLVNGSGTFSPGNVPVGTYEIRATFTGKSVKAGHVKIRKGQHVSLSCSSFMMVCKAK